MKLVAAILLFITPIFCRASLKIPNFEVQKFSENPQKSPKIVGGFNANITSVPYISSFQYCTDAKICIHICSSVIINHNTVLTAARCILGVDPLRFWIRAGSEVTAQGGQYLQVRKFIAHPEYRVFGYYNDLAVLKLWKSFIFGRTVMPIGLPPVGYKIKDGSELMLAGWGNLNEYGGLREELQMGHLPYVSNKKCAEMLDNVRPEKICAGGETRNACRG